MIDALETAEPPRLPPRKHKYENHFGHIAACPSDARRRGKQPATARHAKNLDERMSECAGDCCNRVCVNCRQMCHRCAAMVCPECSVLAIDPAAVEYERICLACLSFVTNLPHEQYVSQIATEAAPSCYPPSEQSVAPDHCPQRRRLPFDEN